MKIWNQLFLEKERYTLLENDEFNDDEKLMNLLMILHLRTMKIRQLVFSSEFLSKYN